jgi:beta-lactamase class D
MQKILLLSILTIWSYNSFGQTNYQIYFDESGLTGSTTIYDYNNKKWFFTDKQDAKTATLPASTFKILHSLIALEYKAVQNEDEIFEWDGEPKLHLGNVVNAWNRDTDLKGAYENSVIWFYEEVARKIGREAYKKILTESEYGNGNYSEPDVDFWNYGQFAITPINQIEFLIKLYENRLPFSESTIETVKNLMISGKTDTSTFWDKTGWTRRNGTDIGWWIGYAVTDGNVYFFATRILKNEKDEIPNFLRGRKEITKLILNEVTQRN